MARYLDRQLPVDNRSGWFWEDTWQIMYGVDPDHLPPDDDDQSVNSEPARSQHASGNCNSLSELDVSASGHDGFNRTDALLPSVPFIYRVFFLFFFFCSKLVNQSCGFRKGWGKGWGAAWWRGLHVERAGQRSQHQHAHLPTSLRRGRAAVECRRRCVCYDQLCLSPKLSVDQLLSFNLDFSLTLILTFSCFLSRMTAMLASRHSG